MNTFIVENKFTGYRAEIKTRNELPAVSTVKRHFRKSKASDCVSATTIKDNHGNGYDLADIGRGLQIVAMY